VGRLTVQNAALGVCSQLGMENEIFRIFLSFLLGQGYAPEKILKALIRAVSVENWVNSKVSHPNSMIVIGGLQPFERILILV
jgi:hypothetical protein